MTELKRLLDAVAFAANKHRDQRRKGAQQAPYINHPVEVARLLADVGGVTDVEVLMAAVLHDTIEDTATTAAELEERFGSRVLGMVLEVTDDKSLDFRVRKRLQIEHAGQLSPGARLIKLADKIANVFDISMAPPPNWSIERRREYLDWTERVIAGVRGASAALEARYDEVLRAGRDRIEREAQLVRGATETGPSPSQTNHG